jgi:membrane fusion protein, multidrug efflux system
MGPRSWIGMLSSVVHHENGFANRRGPSWGPALRSQASLWLIFCAALGLTVPGCEKAKTQAPPKEIPDAVVSQPLERDVTDFADFTGRTEAIHSVNIVPRVTGYLTKMPFKEGSEVKKDDLLFEVDPRPYQAQFDQAQSQVGLYQAQLELAQSTLKRYEALDKSTPGAVSKQELDQYRAAVVEADARVAASRKSLEVYQLNKDFTQVKSPIDGQVSRYYLTLGNLVNQDQTLLTTVVSLDPMHVNFDMDERTLLQIRRAIYEGRITPYETGDIPVYMGLQGEEGFRQRGTINFVNNQVNPSTGSITLRGVFANPKLTRTSPALAASTVALLGSLRGEAPLLAIPALLPPKTTPRSGRMMSPGMFVRVRLPIGEPHRARLVIDRAIMSDQGKKYVYVVDGENKAQTKYLTTGALQPDGLRVVEGLKNDDLVVVGNLQNVRAREEIKPDKKPMPSLASPPEKETSKVEKPKT